MVRTVSTPAASNPSNTRRTMFTFSLLLNTEPCATRRRISLPEDGFAIIPTHATRDPSYLSSCTGTCEIDPIQAQGWQYSMAHVEYNGNPKLEEERSARLRPHMVLCLCQAV